jgi:hypothetical protein
MYAGGARKEGAVNEEMVRIRMDELQAEASRARMAREARGSQRWRHYLGILGVSGAARGEAGGFSRGMVEEACCA